MYRNFEKLNEVKQQRILEACIQEFAEKGYENASTNVIIKDAEISKGILFHYFGNKKSLFLYVVEHCLQFFISEYRKYPRQLSGDILDRILELGMIKLKITHANPKMSKLVLHAYMNTPKDIRTEIHSKYAKLSNDLLPSIFEDIDVSVFRNGVDPKKALEMVMLFLAALQEKYTKAYVGREQELLGDMEKIMEEYSEYVDILKYGMYAHQLT